MECITYELALDCVVSLEKNLKRMKKKSYMITTLFHDHSSASEEHITDLDAKGSAYLKFKDVNLESDFLRFQIFNEGWLFAYKRFGTFYVSVSQLVSSSITSDRQMGRAGLEMYGIGTSSKKYTGDLRLGYKLSKAPEGGKAEVESKHVALAIGNDMVQSLRTPLLSCNWRS